MEETRKLLGLLLMVQQDLGFRKSGSKFTYDTINRAIGIVERQIKKGEE